MARLVRPGNPSGQPGPPRSFYVCRGKRLLDLALGSALLLVTSPVQVVVAASIRYKMGRPVLFRQQRPGLHGVPFEMLKFRTMSDVKDSDGNHIPDAERLTPLGRFLRSTSLDELPELVNVVRGDISLVGPRPLLMKYLERYTPRQHRRHEVRPGVTGLAQVSGRNALSWDEKFELDVQYVDNASLRLDLSILARTVWNVLARKGISAESHVTMPEFGIDTAA